MTETFKGFSTRSIHAGEKLYAGSVTQAIFQSSTYVYQGEQGYEQVKYARLNNTPNHETLSEKLRSLENTEDAVVTASGMAAISTTLLALTEPGDEILSQDCLYGGTHYFLRDDMEKFGRKVSYFPTDQTDSFEKYLTPKTRLIYVEVISNPLMKVPNLAHIAKVGKERGILTVIDNTFASPVNFNPSTMGFSVMVHSATKYLNGHSDVVAGAVMGDAASLKKVRRLLTLLGSCLDPHACFLLNRGIKTLGVRVRQQNETALALAQSLEKFKKVAHVLYPGLPSHADHARAKEWFLGSGGVLSFLYQGSVEALENDLKKLKLPFSAPSLGGVESLITRPVTTSHSGMSPAERSRLGISDALVRVSVGLEDTEDLIRDFATAFN